MENKVSIEEKKKAFLVLFGEGNTGKTTTLRQLIRNLSGLSKLPSKDDVRVIVKYRDKNIYISTYGDTKEHICRNVLFFGGEYTGKIGSNDKVFFIDNGGTHEVAASRYDKLFKPSILISACHPGGAPAAMNLAFSQTVMNKLDYHLWIRKVKDETADNAVPPYGHNNPSPSDITMANHLKDIIDKVIDNKLIP